MVTFLFFSTCFSPIIVHLRNIFLLRTPVSRILLTPRCWSRRDDVKSLSINKSELKVVVEHSISQRTKFSSNVYLVEETTYFPFFLHLSKLNFLSHLPLQQGRRFHVLLESTCYLLFAYCHEFHVPYQGIIQWNSSAYWKRTLRISYLTH